MCELKEQISESSNDEKIDQEKLWLDMMENIQIFTETSSALMKSLQTKMGILKPEDNDLTPLQLIEKLKAYMEEIQAMRKSACKCKPEEKTSNSNEDQEEEEEDVPPGIDLHQRPRVIKKKKFKYSSDLESRIIAKKKKEIHLDPCRCVRKKDEKIVIVDACLCNSIPKNLKAEFGINDGVRTLKVCSALGQLKLYNVECLKEEKQKVKKPSKEPDLIASILKPGTYDPDELPQDDSHPFIIKSFGKPFELPNFDLLGKQIFSSMTSFGNRVAQIDGITGESETYTEFSRKTISTALKLEKMCTHDDIIGICSSNHKNICIPYLAALFNGNKVVAFDRTMTKENLVMALENVTPKIMFVSLDTVGLMENCMLAIRQRFRLIIFEETEDETCFETFLNASLVQIEDYEPNEVGSLMSTAIICFTSGYIDEPKAVCLTHFGLLKQCWQLVENGCILPMILDFSEINLISYVLILIASFFSGSTRVIVENFETANVWALIEKFKIKTVHLLLQQCIELSKSPEPTEDISSLFNIQVDGAKLGEGTIIKLQGITSGRIICQTYGDTELSGLLASHKLSDPADLVNVYFNIESCGKAIDGVLYKVIDVDTGKMLDHSKVGELFIKSKMVRRGYFVNNEEIVKDDYEQWISTEDLVSYDTYFNFHNAGKKKSVIKYENKTVVPSKFEDIFLKHPSVESAIVIGFPLGENAKRIIAFVAVSDKENISSEDLHVFWRKQQKPYVDSLGLETKLEIKILDRMPYHNGKINRSTIINRILSNEI